MSEFDISKMDFKQLRNEVQLLRDELAIFKRKYEDAINNIDSSNFSTSFTQEQDNMKTQLKVSANAIKLMASKTDLETALEDYATLTVTADAIRSAVSKGASREDAKEISSLDEALDVGKVYVIKSYNASGEVTGERYYYFNSLIKQWELLSDDSIYTVFEQTSDGFSLRGNVKIDGNAVVTENLTLSGKVTWDMSNSPVLSQYSSDLINWHSPMTDGDIYMRMSFDGGVNWSDATKIVGEDGRDGYDGSDAYVTDEDIFNMLTNHGEDQGLFAAFVNNGNKLYINAEYLATRIADVAETIYLGDYYDNTQKMIVFSDTARISNFEDGITGYTGLSLSASTVAISGGVLDFSGCTSINWGDNAVGGSGVAVFG